jgi:hypothetical protein
MSNNYGFSPTINLMPYVQIFNLLMFVIFLVSLILENARSVARATLWAILKYVDAFMKQERYDSLKR